MPSNLFEIVSFYEKCLDSHDWTTYNCKPKCLGFRAYTTNLIVVYKVNDVCYCKFLEKLMYVSE